ncbi:MAG: response regulator transcription factor [Acidimicrobiales bacterium]
MSSQVLVVEDDPAIGAGLCRALKATGYDAPWARNGAEARRLLATSTPDLVLMDLGLPDEDGLDLCAAVQRDRPGLPVIMLTARAEEMDVVVGLDSGAVDYITKPFRLAELLARVHAQLRQRRQVLHTAPPQPAPAGGTYVVGDLEIDLDARRAGGRRGRGAAPPRVRPARPSRPRRRPGGDPRAPHARRGRALVGFHQDPRRPPERPAPQTRRATR